jgi:putative FmdB family regulatory protein
MPIYAYKCDACGHAKDVLQKISDPVLTDCPACGAASFKKQVTAAGFQLKGSGWYVTDFRGGNAAPAGEKSDASGAASTLGAPSTAVAPSTTASTPAPVTPSASPASTSAASTSSSTASSAAPTTSAT